MPGAAERAARRTARPVAALGAAAALLGDALAGQRSDAAAPTAGAPRVDVAIAGGASRGTVPAWAWLCEQFLPALPAWPPGLDPTGPIAVTLTSAGLRIAPTAVQLPADVVAAGSASFGAGPPLCWRCNLRGNEDWYVPDGFVLPDTWRTLLRAVAADALDVPHTVAVPVLAGHLAGALLDGDRRATALRLGAAQCGELTWLAWANGRELRVRGRSDGGVMLPAVLLALATIDGSGTPRALGLRAFGARDGDRGEAARQLGRDDRPADLATLRCLLQADDALRLTAIDALVRQRAADELPRIVAAAAAEMPWATLAAGDALRALWADASPAVREATRAALQRSDSVALRGIDVDALPAPGARRGGPPAAPNAAEAAPHVRVLVALGLLAIGVAGLWARERARLRLAREATVAAATSR